MSMNKIFLPLLFFLGLDAYGQSLDVATLDTSLNRQWIRLANNWRFQKGDNAAWAEPGFDDASWPLMTGNNLNLPDLNPLTKKGEIAWFRKRVKADNNLLDALVLNIYQTGASEIYLDGKLIHKLGEVSSNPDEVVFYNPNGELLALPLQTKEQVLAIRFMNDFGPFPIYKNSRGYIGLLVTTLGNGSSNDYKRNAPILRQQKIISRYYITFGVSIFLLILFTSFFWFFPNEKINGYFALSSFFLSLFIGFVLISLHTFGKTFWIDFFWSLFSNIHILIVLYCVYKIFNRPFGIVYKAIWLVGFIGIPLLFVFDADIIATVCGVLVLFEIIRINLISIKVNGTGAFIFLTYAGINVLFWVNYLTNLFPYFNEFLPFAFMLVPISLAIYLGYSFGAQSQELRVKLSEIEQLSNEKQAILFLQNETLEKQVKERTFELNQSFENLKSTQVQLIQSEKMASLGELTAGIAHEIQNPLNFVNNFSEVSNELMGELVDEVDKGNTGEVKIIAKDVQQNLEKILHHGKRADSIVKGMLQHSRSSSGQKEPTDVNALCDEYLRLAYHGLKAKDPSFNASFHFEPDETLPKMNVVPQDIGRVLLNLINNAFYAVNEKKGQQTDGYEPTVTVSTKKAESTIQILVKDNGNGIPQKVLYKIFQPFFTTKPTGQGTGLGLSLSYDIVKGQGGELKVETKEGKGTVFMIVLPI